MSQPEYPYDQSMFDSGYYGGGARGGFRSYQYNESGQQFQLQLKYNNCAMAPEYKSILFVGCAKGFEVKYFRAKGKAAFGVDISQYAISNCEPEAKPYCQLYNGSDIEAPDNSYDAVVAFDVLTLVPDGMIQKLTREMARVASKKIMMRTITKSFQNANQEWDGNDGVTYKYKTFNQWDEWMSVGGKFTFFHGVVSGNYEGVYTWKRV
jgi:ubiquinone/menaquinone biosynthesis C-methylase UbiE